MNRNQDETPTTNPDPHRHTVDPQRATKLVKMTLTNDAGHHGNWVSQAHEIRKDIPDSLSTSTADLLADGVISETDAVRLQLATRIRRHVENVRAVIFDDGTEEIRDGAPTVGLLETAAERFVSAADWQSVAEAFMPGEE